MQFFHEFFYLADVFLWVFVEAAFGDQGEVEGWGKMEGVGEGFFVFGQDDESVFVRAGQFIQVLVGGEMGEFHGVFEEASGVLGDQVRIFHEGLEVGVFFGEGASLLVVDGAAGNEHDLFQGNVFQAVDALLCVFQVLDLHGEAA